MPTIRRFDILMLAMLALVSIATLLGLPRGVRPGALGQYWHNAEWAGSPVVTAAGVMPTTADLDRQRRLVRSNPMSAEWMGFLSVERPGRYRFDVTSTGAVQLYIDDVPVASMMAGSAEASGHRTLTAGAHVFRLRYAGTGAPHGLSVVWTAPGERARGLTPLQVSADKPPGARIRYGPAIRVASVAIPTMWAVLLLYIPVRLLGAWMWRDVRRAVPAPDARAALMAVLVLACGLAVWGIEWGIVGDRWAPDELRPGLVREAMAQRFAGGWHDKYPAMHYMVLGLPLSAFALADQIPALAADPMHAFVAQYVCMRLISTLMGLGALIALYLCAVEVVGPRRAVLAPLALSLTPLYVFYAKLANLDIPTLCWFGWALLGFIRVVRRGERRDYVLLGLAAAASVATKDQAYANLALLPMVVFGVTVARQPHAAWWGRVAQACVDRRLVAGAAAALAATLVLHNVLVNPSGFASHLRVLSEFNDIAIVPRTLAGAAALAWQTLDLFRISLGWPIVLLAAVGIGRAVLLPDRRWWLWLLLVPLSFHLTFTWVTFFVCDRYLFGGIFVLTLFAAAALDDLLGASTHRGAALAVAAVALGWSLLPAASINMMMNLDARQTARAWVQEHAAAGAVVGLVGHYVPAVPPPLRETDLASTRDVRAAAPDFIIVNERCATRFQRMRRPDGRELMAALRAGSLGYEQVFESRARVPAWALLQYGPAFSNPAEAWWTNLDKVNPQMSVYRRR